MFFLCPLIALFQVGIIFSYLLLFIHFYATTYKVCGKPAAQKGFKAAAAPTRTTRSKSAKAE